jgi:hypothetical protein
MIIHNLIENLRKPIEPKKINLIIDGGAFKGGYIHGALLYLKELERQRFITIEKISGTSIGAIFGVMYLTDKLEEFDRLYHIIRLRFNSSLKLNTFYKMFENDIVNNTKDICNILTNKLYINYFDIEKKNEVVVSVYKSEKDILKYIQNTSYIPIFTDGKLCYNNSIDGIVPYLFYDRDISDPKNLIINLHDIGTYKQMINTKNEKNCEHRRLTGILEIHHFFLHNEKSKMCSYIEDWKPRDFIVYRMKAIIRLIIGYFIYFTITINKYIPMFIKDNIFFIKVLHNVRQLFLDYFIYYIIN